MNIMAFMHAYKFTHFSNDAGNKTEQSKSLNFSQKLSIAFFGVNNPKPVNKRIPDKPFEEVNLNGIHSWIINVEKSKGTIILLHGYGGEKSSMLDKASIFQQLGYNTMLVDFRGSGKSEGVNTTIGYKEAKEVIESIHYLKNKGEESIILFGTSMGAAAAMKALHDKDLPVSALIIECPFGSLLQTVKNRFSYMGVPPFPMASLLVFWGGIQNNFNGFNHNPIDYAKNIKIPTLLFWGEKDPKVSLEETHSIYENLQGKKKLVNLPEAGHENYLIKYKDLWTEEISMFLSEQKKTS